MGCLVSTPSVPQTPMAPGCSGGERRCRCLPPNSHRMDCQGRQAGRAGAGAASHPQARGQWGTTPALDETALAAPKQRALEDKGRRVALLGTPRPSAETQGSARQGQRTEFGGPAPPSCHRDSGNALTTAPWPGGSPLTEVTATPSGGRPPAPFPPALTPLRSHTCGRWHPRGCRGGQGWPEPHAPSTLIDGLRAPATSGGPAGLRCGEHPPSSTRAGSRRGAGRTPRPAPARAGVRDLLAAPCRWGHGDAPAGLRALRATSKSPGHRGWSPTELNADTFPRAAWGPLHLAARSPHRHWPLGPPRSAITGTGPHPGREPRVCAPAWHPTAPEKPGGGGAQHQAVRPKCRGDRSTSLRVVLVHGGALCPRDHLSRY